MTDWPKVGHANELVLDRMTQTREIIEQGLAKRMFKDENEVQIKVRQPLSTLTYRGEKLDAFYESIIAEEVNVKTVTHEPTNTVLDVQDATHAHVSDIVVLDKIITPELRREGLAREVIRHVQSARKAAGLNVDDRIVLGLVTEEAELSRALKEHTDSIALETLANDISENTYAHTSEATIEGAVLTVSLEKA